MLTCIHAESGLCPSCQEAYDEDWQAYDEYGDHPAGIARWEALQAEMEAERLAHPLYGLTAEEEAEIPF